MEARHGTRHAPRRKEIRKKTGKQRKKDQKIKTKKTRNHAERGSWKVDGYKGGQERGRKALTLGGSASKKIR
jgi:hypothetical protein